MRPGPLAVLLTAAVLVAGGCDRSGPPVPGPTTPPPPPGPTALAWRQLAPAPSARTEVVAAAVGTQIYLVGGYRADGGTVDTVEVLDTSTGTWRSGPPLPVPVNHAMATTVDGVVHVFGGYLADNRPSTAAYRLDGGWVRIADLPEGRAAGTAAAIGSRAYLAGGIAPGGGPAGEMLVYDGETGRWSTAPGPPTPREHLGGGAHAGRLYTVGGRTRAAGNLAALEMYDPDTNRWTGLADLPTPRGGLAAAVGCAGHLVAVGGEAAETFPEVEAYDIEAGSWRTLPALPTPRHGLGVVTVGPVLYVLAGGPRPGLHVADAAEALDLAPLGPCPSG